jgi:hypothetical protein
VNGRLKGSSSPEAEDCEMQRRAELPTGHLWLRSPAAESPVVEESPCC